MTSNPARHTPSGSSTPSTDPSDLLNTQAAFVTIGNGSAARPDYREKILLMRVIMLPFSITTDANRDGKIDLTDRKLITEENPWRFWINDDNDSGATEGDDIPMDAATQETNGYDYKINGMRDLIDFFPLDLNLKAVFKIFPRSKYEYKIVHSAPQSAPCLKIVHARELVPDDSDSYLKDLDAASATSGLESLPVHSLGRNLNSRFLDTLEDDGTGLLLVEGIRPTTDPIRLRIVRKSDQAVMGEVEFPVSIRKSMEMIRWKFVSPREEDLDAGNIPVDPPITRST